MPVDIAAASAFMTSHARLLDRRRFAVRFLGADPAPALAALDAYRNDDGGYGALEPDLRADESQPVAAMHAFEVFEDVAPATTPRAAALCDWLDAVSVDGGLPFALPIADATATAPFWAEADHDVPSLHITAAVTAVAARVARHDPAVAGHPWFERASRFCLGAIEQRTGTFSTLEVMYSLRLLDALGDDHPGVAPLVDRLAAVVPASGVLPVEGGLPDEVVRPLQLAPFPDGPVRRALPAAAVAADLDRLAEGQRPDGGWEVDFAAHSPAAALEWRGWATVEALATLRANGRL